MLIVEIIVCSLSISNKQYYKLAWHTYLSEIWFQITYKLQFYLPQNSRMNIAVEQNFVLAIS